MWGVVDNRFPKKSTSRKISYSLKNEKPFFCEGEIHMWGGKSSLYVKVLDKLKPQIDPIKKAKNVSAA